VDSLDAMNRRAVLGADPKDQPRRKALGGLIGAGIAQPSGRSSAACAQR
jgi:hypothetical protein